MSFIDKFYTKLISNHIGFDQYGNEYRLGWAKDYLGKNKRYVIYKGLEITCKVPPMWHAWLHYLTDDIPNNQEQTLYYSWQREHQPNLSGTKYAYSPIRHTSKKKLHQKWRP